MNKETLKQSIEEMKVKLAEMEVELKKADTFKWEYKKNETYAVDIHYTSGDYTGTNKEYLKYGLYRQKESNAKHSLLRGMKGNRQEALVEQIQGKLSEFVYGEDNYYIYRNKEGSYVATEIYNIYQEEAVYMKEETAKKICEMLNNKEFSLEGEL